MTSVSPAPPLPPPLQRMGITVSVSPRGSKIPNHLSHKPTKHVSGQVNESHTNAHDLPEITVTKVLKSSS